MKAIKVKHVPVYFDKTFNNIIFINPNDIISFYKNGKYHREDGPARIFRSGFVEYYCNGIWYGYYKSWKIKIKQVKELRRLEKLKIFI